MTKCDLYSLLWRYLKIRRINNSNNARNFVYINELYAFVMTNSKFKQTNHRKVHANQSRHVPPTLKNWPMAVEVGGALGTTAQDSNWTWLRRKMLMKARKIEGKSTILPSLGVCQFQHWRRDNISEVLRWTLAVSYGNFFFFAQYVLWLAITGFKRS